MSRNCWAAPVAWESPSVTCPAAPAASPVSPAAAEARLSGAAAAMPISLSLIEPLRVRSTPKRANLPELPIEKEVTPSFRPTPPCSPPPAWGPTPALASSVKLLPLPAAHLFLYSARLGPSKEHFRLFARLRQEGGILLRFALGDLDPDELRQVRRRAVLRDPLTLVKP